MLSFTAGIMLYEKALRRLTALEQPLAATGGRFAPAEYEAALDDLMAAKFTYVIASQVPAHSVTATRAPSPVLVSNLISSPAARCTADDLRHPFGRTLSTDLCRTS